MGYNYLGEKICDRKLSDKEISANASFLKTDGTFNWPDDNGFDSNYDIAGQGSKVPIVFHKGKAFVRYGNNGGKLMADKGVPYEMLGLPYRKELKEYHEYVLQKEVKIEECGFIAPAFNSSGGVMQYYVKGGIQNLLNKNILKEDEAWRKITTSVK